MEKAKAIAHVKDMYAHMLFREDKEALETLIPELKESEDERIRKWLYELIDRMSYDNLTEKERTKNEEWKKKVLAWLEKQKEQKPAEWDEKDEKVYDYLKSGFEYASNNPNLLNSVLSGASDATIQDYRNFIDKLKILRPQPKAEWSEEDKDMLNSCISSIEEAKENRYAYKETDGDTSYDHEIAWLKSLRPQWRPSEEQMEALLNIEGDLRAFQYNDKAKIIAELYEQLKRL